jgi:hypothetical protein
MSNRTEIVAPSQFLVTLNVTENRIIVRNLGGPQVLVAGGALWGNITGTLSNQTDLQAALDAKADSVDIITDHTALTNIGTNTHAQIDSHIASTTNPHAVTKSQVGLGNADNTSDINKPVSTAQQTALDLKENSANKTTNFTGNTGSNTLFATVKATFDAIVGYLANYQTLLGFNPANENLSNLTSTAVNDSIHPASDLSIDLGQSGLNWRVINAGELQYGGSSTIDLVQRLLVDSNIKGSINFENRAALDSAEVQSIDYDDRLLLDASANNSLSWGDREAFDSAGNSSVDWQGRVLSDSAAGPSVQYGTRALLDNNGLTSVDWGNRRLEDDSEVLAVDYIDRRLLASNGSSVNLDWSSSTGPTSVTQSSSDNSTKVATTAFVQTHSKTQTDTFTSSGTWNKPSWAKRVRVILRGGSGGGGSGRRGAAASIRFGGGSGVVSSIAWMDFDAADLGATEDYVVGAGGVGGASASVNDTNGVAGSAGGASSFGTTVRLKVPSSVGGGGGTAAAGNGGTGQQITINPFGTIQISGAAGGSANGTSGGGRTDIVASTASGGGAGIPAGNSNQTGGSGGQFTANSYAPTTSGGAGGTAGGGDGGNAVDSGLLFMGIPIGAGAGGGGSGGSGSVPGGRGGNGFTSGGVHVGAAGGGGAASLNGFNSGAGGTGSDGIVVIISEG